MVKENSRLIADFMNWQHHEDKEYDAYEMTNLKYYTSWDLLMPVVEKIEDMGYNVDIDGTRCYISEGSCNRDGGKDFKILSDFDASTKIAATYLTVLDFLQVLHREPNPQERDARKDDSSTKVGSPNKN